MFVNCKWPACLPTDVGRVHTCTVCIRMQEGDLEKLSAEEQREYRIDLVDDLENALKAYVVHVECRRLRAGSIIADCVATLKVAPNPEPRP